MLAWQASAEDKTKEPEVKKRLIITTGDTSDVDGFLAIAEYSKASFRCSCTLKRLTLFLNSLVLMFSL